MDGPAMDRMNFPDAKIYRWISYEWDEFPGRESLQWMGVDFQLRNIFSYGWIRISLCSETLGKPPGIPSSRRRKKPTDFQ